MSADETLETLTALAHLRSLLQERFRCPVASAVLALMDDRARLLLSDLTVSYVRDRGEGDEGVRTCDLEWAWLATPHDVADADKVAIARAAACSNPSANAEGPTLTLHTRALVAIAHAASLLTPHPPPPSIPLFDAAAWGAHLLRRLSPAHFDPHAPLPPAHLRSLHAAHGKHSPTTFRLLDLLGRATEPVILYKLLGLGEPKIDPVAAPALVARVERWLKHDLATRRNCEVLIRNAICGSLAPWGALAERERRGVRVFNASDVLRDRFTDPLTGAFADQEGYTSLLNRILAWRSGQSTEAWEETWRQVAYMECFCALVAERVPDPMRPVSEAGEGGGVGKVGIVAVETMVSRDYYLRWYEWGTRAALLKAIRSRLYGRPTIPQIWHMGDGCWWVRVGDATPDAQTLAIALLGEEANAEGRPTKWVRCRTAPEAIAEFLARSPCFEHGHDMPTVPP